MICARCRLDDLLNRRPTRAVPRHPSLACSDIGLGGDLHFKAITRSPDDSLPARGDVTGSGELEAASAPLPLRPASPACSTQNAITGKMGTPLLWSCGFIVSLITVLTV